MARTVAVLPRGVLGAAHANPGRTGVLPWELELVCPAISIIRRCPSVLVPESILHGAAGREVGDAAIEKNDTRACSEGIIPGAHPYTVMSAKGDSWRHAITVHRDIRAMAGLV